MNVSQLRASRGFSLIELMIAVAIVAILATIAYPSYSDYVIRGRIPEATTGLSDARVRMEQAFQDNRTYVGTEAVGWNATSTCNARGPQGANPNFQFTCAGTATTFTVTATGTGSMTNFNYTINEQNQRVTTSLGTGWGTAPNNCWAIKKGGQC